MASTRSSAQHSSIISQVLDEIINTKQDAPDFDLDQLIASTDSFLALYTANNGNSSRCEESSSTSGASNISQALSNNIEILAKKITEYAGNEHSAVISVLRAAGNVHWSGLCLLLVAAVLYRMDIINRNQMETLDLLNCMNELAKEVRKLKGMPRAKDEMVTQINESIDLIVRGAILCCSQKTTKGVKRSRNSPKARDDLIALRSKVKKTYNSLHPRVHSLSIQESSLICNQPPIHSIEHGESAPNLDRREIFVAQEVFLSHSGKQKSLVKQLYRDLTNQGVSCFFDQDPESLPLGEDFPSRIFEAAKTCKVAVLVLSMDFLQTKWPMIELAAFVEARDITRTNPNLKILPLFFLISPDALKPNNEKCKQLGVSEEEQTKWCNALKAVRRNNGLKFSTGDDEGEFLDKIVKIIWHIIPPSPRYHVPQTQEQVRMCQEVADLFKKIHSDKKGISFAGLYGMPGVGKTTLGKAFCNFKLGEFEGKVCHLEFSCGDPLQRVKLALQYLCQCSSWILQALTNTDQAKVEFDKRVVGRRVLLVLDNITEENIGEVSYFLQAEFGKDSCILLSARSLDVLVKHFNVESQTCMLVPSLEKEEDLGILLERIRTEESIFGVHEQIGEVVKLLQWENDAPSIAVIVHGIGGSGKTTLADAVYDFWRYNRKGWKYSKISLPQDLREYRKVEELQSFILQHLTGQREEVPDSRSGRQRLKEVMEKESIFLYIDNALFKEPLQELLPRELTNPRKLRLLLTARNMIISDVMEDCRVKSDIYSIEPLPLEAAIQMLRRKISPEKNTSSLSGERPELEVIAKKCRSCPLFLEVVGGFLRRRRNEVEAYERVFQWMENGEPFSGHKEDRFDEERIMFAFDQLEPNAQEAFLDICSFFYGWQWDWDEVKCIVGEEEMECLEEGALIKKKNEISEEGKIITKVSIHDLLLSVGCNKSRNNRFRTAEEFTKAMQNDKPLQQIKGAWLTNFGVASTGKYGSTFRKEKFRGPIDVPAEALDAMSGSLRVFAMGKWTFVKGKCTQRFDQLRFVQTDGGSSLPMDISNVRHLTYIECSLQGNTKVNERKDLSALKVVNVSCPPKCWNFNQMCEGLYLNKLWKLDLGGYPGTGISNVGKLSHLRRLKLSKCSNLMELPESLGRLSLLEELDLTYCDRLKRLPVGFGNLTALVALNLCSCGSLEELPMDFVNLSSLKYLNISWCESLQGLPKNFEKLASLRCLNLNSCSKLLSLPEQLGNLQCLRNIYFDSCKKLSSLPQSLGGMTSKSMSEMSFICCSSLTELPEETSWLSGMTEIYFGGWSSLKRLPTEFSKLTCLQKLSFNGCESIQELCNDFHRLEALKKLYLTRCRSLSTLPPGFGKLTSLQALDLSECGKLEELCNDFHFLGALKELNLSGCVSLTKFPEYFGQLVCLEKAVLSGCSNLASLSNDFHCLGALKELYLSGCVSLTKLPEYFGQLVCLEKAVLAGCSNLANLSNDFHCLGALKELNLSGCVSLTKLPEYFHQLVSLVKADLSGCSNLACLSNDFHTLPLLIRINLSNCKRLGAEWMNVVGATQSLCYADISGNEGMTQRWNEMQKEREQWDLVVVTESSSKDIKGTLWPLILEKFMWRIFSKAGLQIDALLRQYRSSSLQPCVRLILITERYSLKPEVWGMVERNLERLQCISKEWAIIYIGNHIPSELADRTVAHSPFNSFLTYFRDVLPIFFSHNSPGVFMASTIITLERNTVEYLSTWEDISYISDEFEFLKRNPSGSNVELLKILCETQETDFLLHNDEQVKVNDLEGKVVLIFREMGKLETSALEDIYLKLQRSSDYPFEVVFIPYVRENTDPKDYERAVTNAPWPMVPKSWLINKGCGTGLMVVDEKGIISHEDAMPMILRWGIKAYPFSTNREVELTELEWKEFNFSSQSSLEFVFQNMKIFQPRKTEETEAIIQGEMLFLCVGPIDKMLEFLPQLTDALRRLKNVIHVMYIADPKVFISREYETKRKEMCSITSMSFDDARKFWQRMEYLWYELISQGVNERILQLRSMVLALFSAMQRKFAVEEKWKGISIIATDGKGETINGSCEEMVELLCHSDEERRDEFMREIESEGLSNVLREKWTIHHEDHPRHPLTPLRPPKTFDLFNLQWFRRIKSMPEVKCDRCFQVIAFHSIRYQCSVCENYKMCKNCFQR